MKDISSLLPGIHSVIKFARQASWLNAHVSHLVATINHRRPLSNTMLRQYTKQPKRLMDGGHSIRVLAHSYGGMDASEAISPDLYASRDDNDGKGVIALILLSAGLIQPGDSLTGLIGKYGFQCKVDLGDNGDGTVFAKNASESFYNDIESKEAEEFATRNFTHNIFAASGGILGAPWKDLSKTYIHCSRDLAIMLPLQQRMVQDAVNAGGKIITKTLDSGHCPFLTQTRGLFSRSSKISGVNEKIEFKWKIDWAFMQSCML